MSITSISQRLKTLEAVLLFPNQRSLWRVSIALIALKFPAIVNRQLRFAVGQKLGKSFHHIFQAAAQEGGSEMYLFKKNYGEILTNLKQGTKRGSEGQLKITPCSVGEG